MDKILTRLNRKLSKHFGPIFNPPATEIEIKAAEGRIGLTFPEQLKTLYRTFNGEIENGPGVFFGLSFLSLEQMIEEWQVWANLEEENGYLAESFSIPAGWIKERYINRNWLPIAHDHGGNHIGIDLNPDVKGTYGQIINFGRDEEIKYVIAHSLEVLLNFMVETIKKKRYHIEKEDGYVTWSYGKKSIHFLDVLKALELPVYHPHVSQITKREAYKWYADLDHGWKEIVDQNADDPLEFLQRKCLLFNRYDLPGIEPLKYATQACELILSGQPVKDFSILQYLIDIRKLYIAKTPIHSLSGIENLQQLKLLDINNTEIEDLTSLLTLKNLKELDITGIKAKNLSPLTDLLQLRSLTVSIENTDQFEAVTKIKNLEQLHILSIKNVPFKSFKKLANLTNMKFLNMEQANIETFSFLNGCDQLEELILSDTYVKDGAGLEKVPCLKSLELRGTTVNGFEKIVRSRTLQTFTGSYQQFSLLKDLFEQEVDFSSLVGGTSDEEHDAWIEFLNSKS